MTNYISACKIRMPYIINDTRRFSCNTRMAESLEKYFRQFELEKPRNRLEAGEIIATKAFAVFLSALTIYWVFHILYVSGLLFVSCPSKGWRGVQRAGSCGEQMQRVHGLL